MMRGLGASTRLWELVDRVPAIPYDSGIHPEAGLRGQISFRDVHFAYPTRPDNVIFKGMALSCQSLSGVCLKLSCADISYKLKDSIF